MAEFDGKVGWCLVEIAAIFSLSLGPPLAGKFYPQKPAFPVRLAASIIFGGMSVACFAGVGVLATIMVIMIGFKLAIAKA